MKFYKNELPINLRKDSTSYFPNYELPITKNAGSALRNPHFYRTSKTLISKGSSFSVRSKTLVPE